MINLNPLGYKSPRHKHDCSRFRFSAGRGDRSRLRMAHTASSGGVRGEGGERGEGDGEGIRCARSGGGEAGVKGSSSTSCWDGTMSWKYRYTHIDTCNQWILFYSKSLNIKVHPAIKILHFGGERSLWSGSQFLQNQHVDSRSSRDPFIFFWWACVRPRKPRLLMLFGIDRIERPTLKFHPVQAVPL